MSVKLFVPALEAMVDRGLERSRHLRRRSGEAHRVAACRHVLDGKPTALEPGHDFVEIVLAQPKAVAKLLRRDPAVVVG